MQPSCQSKRKAGLQSPETKRSLLTDQVISPVLAFDVPKCAKRFPNAKMP
jgi:hypothetical protein